MFVRIDDDKIGIVRRKFGRRRSDDKYAIRVHGSPGIQADVLRPGQSYFMLKIGYDVEQVPRTHVPPGTIAVVVARVGANAPSAQPFGQTVECDCFQDGAKFLRCGGQIGRQAMVLGEGTYDINPHIFEVLTVDTIGAGRHGLTAGDLTEIEIPAGDVGVVVTLVGLDHSGDDSLGPPVPGHDDFQDAIAFLAGDGYRGVQAETLSRGIYLINPWFARVVRIPTRTLVLNWSNENNKPTSNFDIALKQIQVNVEGLELRCTISQTIAIPAGAAPRLVQEFAEIGKPGEIGQNRIENQVPVQRFVEKVLGTVVDRFFRSPNKLSIEAFFEDRFGIRQELEQEIRNALADWDVIASSTTVHEFEAEDTELDAILKRISTVRVHESQIAHQLTDVQAKIELLRVAIERDRRRLKLVGEVEWLSPQLEMLSRDDAALRRFLEQLSQMNVPHLVADHAESLLQYMPLQVAMNRINRAIDSEESNEAAGNTEAKRRTGSLTSETSETSELPARRYLICRCPENVRIGDAFSIIARI